MKKARSYRSKHRPVVPLDSLQSAIATAEGAAGRKRAASFLLRAAERIERRENNWGCVALEDAHSEVERISSVFNPLTDTPEGRLYSALYEGSRNRDETGHPFVGWFDFSWNPTPETRRHRLWAFLFAFAVMIDP